MLLDAWKKLWTILQSRTFSWQCPIQSPDEWISNHYYCSSWTEAHGSRKFYKSKFYCVTLRIKHIQWLRKRWRVCWSGNRAASKLIWNWTPWLSFHKIFYLLNGDNGFAKWNSYWNSSGGLYLPLGGIFIMIVVFAMTSETIRLLRKLKSFIRLFSLHLVFAFLFFSNNLLSANYVAITVVDASGINIIEQDR